MLDPPAVTSAVLSVGGHSSKPQGHRDIKTAVVAREVSQMKGRVIRRNSVGNEVDAAHFHEDAISDPFKVPEYLE